MPARAITVIRFGHSRSGNAVRQEAISSASVACRPAASVTSAIAISLALADHRHVGDARLRAQMILDEAVRVCKLEHGRTAPRVWPKARGDRRQAPHRPRSPSGAGSSLREHLEQQILERRC